MGSLRKVAVLCSGVGIERRGYEGSACVLAKHLSEEKDLGVELVCGGEVSAGGFRAVVLPVVRRDGSTARVLCWMFGKQEIYFELASFIFFFLVLNALRRYDVIYVFEKPVYKILSGWGRKLFLRARIITSTGGQLDGLKGDARDVLQVTAPAFLDRATQLGFGETHLVPNVLDTGPGLAIKPSSLSQAEKSIPEGSYVLVSVGSVDVSTKRMDFVIDVVHKLNDESVFLLILGARTPESIRVLEKADRLLGKRYLWMCVDHSDMSSFYARADAFISASLSEGFGNMYTEAMAAGLPVVVDDNDVTRYVVGPAGILVDMTNVETVADTLVAVKRGLVRIDRNEVQRSAISRFGWGELRKPYRAMFLGSAFKEGEAQ